MGYPLRMAGLVLALWASAGLAAAQQPGPMTGTSSTATTGIDLQLTPQQRADIYDSVSKQKLSRTPPPTRMPRCAARGPTVRPRTPALRSPTRCSSPSTGNSTRTSPSTW